MDKPSVNDLANLMGESPDLEPEHIILEQAINYDMPKDEWETKDHNKQATVANLKRPDDRDLSIDSVQQIYLPMFVKDYNLGWVFNAIEELANRDGTLTVVGSPAWVFDRTVLPEFPESALNVEMASAMNSDIDYAIAIAYVNGHSITDLENMQLEGGTIGGGGGGDGAWLDELINLIKQHKTEGNIDVYRAHLPESMKDYQVLSAYMQPDSYMLFSPHKGQGLYVISQQLNMEHNELGVRSNLSADVAIRQFYTDPIGYLQAAGVDLGDDQSKQHGRTRLYLRYWLEATGQGEYIDRSGEKSIPVIEAYIEGEEIPGIDPGILEQLHRLGIICG